MLDIYCCLRCLIHGLALSILNAIGDSAVETQVDFLHFSSKHFVNTVEDFYGIDTYKDFSLGSVMAQQFRDKTGWMMKI